MSIKGAFLAGAVGIPGPGEVFAGGLNGCDEWNTLFGILGFSQKVRIYFYRLSELVVSVAFLIKAIPYFKGLPVEVYDLEKVSLLGGDV